MTRITKEELSPSLVQEIENTVDLTPIETRLTNVESKTAAIGDVSTLVTPVRTDVVGGINSHVVPRTGAFAKHNYYVPNPVVTGDTLDASYIADFSTLTTAGQLSGVAFNITFLEEKTAVQFYIKVNDKLTFMLQNKTSEAFVKFEAGTMYTFVCTGTTFLLAKGGNGGGTGNGGSWGNVNNESLTTLTNAFKTQLGSPNDIRGMKTGGWFRLQSAGSILYLDEMDVNGNSISRTQIPIYVSGTNTLAFVNAVSNDYFDIAVRSVANTNITTIVRYDMSLNVLKTVTIDSSSAGQSTYPIAFLDDNYYISYGTPIGAVGVFHDNHTLMATLTGTSNSNSAHLRKIGDGVYSYNQTSNASVYSVIRVKGSEVNTINALQPFQMINYLAQLSGQ